MNIARMVAAESEGVDICKYLTEPNIPVEIEHLEDIAGQLSQGRPVQYILGHTEFCGIDFCVSEGVLIPRPETEELVAWAAECAKSISQPHILDLCTGSGCIAIALAKMVKDSRVMGIDLSDDALAIADKNNIMTAAGVRFLKADVLQEIPQLQEERFHIIVSNPPYIPISERAAMRPNVIDYEPHMALFVDDDNPLVFYRAIARKAKRALHDRGFLLVEVHELLAQQSADMLREEGFTDIVIRNDCFDKPRMICCQLKRE